MTENDRMRVFAFVIMDNHLHLVQQPCFGFRNQDNQRDFLKFTAQQMFWNFRQENSSWMKELCVNASDRCRQVWERNSLNTSLYTPAVMDQKIDYIHQNPVRAGLVKCPEDYKYSSGRFYLLNDKNWKFLSHIDGD